MILRIFSSWCCKSYKLIGYYLKDWPCKKCPEINSNLSDHVKISEVLFFVHDEILDNFVVGLTCGRFLFAVNHHVLLFEHVHQNLNIYKNCLCLILPVFPLIVTFINATYKWDVLKTSLEVPTCEEAIRIHVYIGEVKNGTARFFNDQL